MNKTPIPPPGCTEPISRAIAAGCRAIRNDTGTVALVELPNEAATVELIGLSNELAPDGRMYIPLGDHPHEAGIQRLDTEAAQAIVKNFNSFLRRAPTNRIPIYVGHPDSKATGHQYPDKNRHGYIKAVALENRDLGDGKKDYLVLQPKYGRKAQEYLENLSYQFFSPSLGGLPIGMENGRRVLRPVHLFSVGLTNSPNIPVIPIANESGNEPTTKENTMLTWLKGFFGLENNATEEDVQTRIKAQSTQLEALANEKTAREAAEQQVTALENEKTTLSTDLATEKAARTTAETALAAERKARVEPLVNEAIAAGKLAPADKDSKLEELCNAHDIDKQLTELANAEVTFKVKGQGKSHGLTKDARQTDKTARIQELVNERCQKTGVSYTDAFASLRKENPELFGDKVS